MTDGPAAAGPSWPHATRTLIQLVDPLDEPEFYCVDVPGFGSGLQLQAALIAHTCKPNGPADEIFAFAPDTGQFRMPAYDLCLEAARAEAGSQLFLKACADHPHQQFGMSTDGLIRLSATQLCLAVDAGAGTPTGGPSHLRRDLGLDLCPADGSSLTRWKMPGLVPG